MKTLAHLTLKAARANLIPGIALQILATNIVLAYYFWEASAPVFQYVADLKAAHGFLYSAIATGFFGGLIPYAYLLWSGRIQSDLRLPILFFFLGFWTWKGIEVDLLYRGQEQLFGSEANGFVVLKKVCFDEFVYGPLISAPGTALAYRWMECRFSWIRFRQSLNRRFLTLEIPSILVANWIVWIPGTAAVYSLPSLLQLPLFNLIVCFFVLVVSILHPKEPTNIPQRADST